MAGAIGVPKVSEQMTTHAGDISYLPACAAAPDRLAAASSAEDVIRLFSNTFSFLELHLCACDAGKGGRGTAFTAAATSAIIQARAHGAQLRVHLARGRSHNQTAQSIACNLDILERPQNVDACLRKDDACAGGIFNRKLCLAGLSS